VLLTAAGFRATPGVLLLPLQHEFGWSPALIGGAVAVNLLVYGLGRAVRSRHRGAVRPATCGR
jgi:hypothetical protein